MEEENGETYSVWCGLSGWACGHAGELVGGKEMERRDGGLGWGCEISQLASVFWEWRRD
jgi:hypothetical protein